MFETTTPQPEMPTMTSCPKPRPFFLSVPDCKPLEASPAMVKNHSHHCFLPERPAVGCCSRIHQNPHSVGTHVNPSFLGIISYNPYIGGLKPSFFHGFWVQRLGYKTDSPLHAGCEVHGDVPRSKNMFSITLDQSKHT